MTAIIYMSKHGTTEKIALSIHKLINKEDVHPIDLSINKKPDISGYNKIIIGGSIHAGAIQKRIRDFIALNLNELMKKEVALFLCCMKDSEEAREQFENAFPEVLRKHAKKIEIVGGEFLFDKMNFFERAIVKKIAGVQENISKIDNQKIAEIADAFR